MDKRIKRIKKIFLNIKIRISNISHSKNENKNYFMKNT